VKKFNGKVKFITLDSVLKTFILMKNLQHLSINIVPAYIELSELILDRQRPAHLYVRNGNDSKRDNRGNSDTINLV